MNKLHDWLIAATTIARISVDAHALGEEITWLRREAHVRGECLEIAMEALRHYDRLGLVIPKKALAQVNERLAQLEPEEETG